MVFTINQILVICLILVLIAFLVILGIMAEHAIGLIRRSKVLVKAGNELIEDATGKVEEVKVRADGVLDKALDTISDIASDTGPVIKALCGAALGLTVFNLISGIRKSLVSGGGVVGSILGRRDRRKAEKQIRESRRTIKQINRQTELEKKAVAKAEKVSAKLRKRESRIAKKDAKAAARNAKHLEKAERKVAAAAVRVALRAERAKERAARKLEKRAEKIAKKIAEKEAGKAADKRSCVLKRMLKKEESSSLLGE